ncbi:60S ribosomal subunit assembly/export protein LOC1 [Talaromyces atroroseus]|uniref:60S ribosomal subunit assembly/export protein LOC1 n=1 Tax=Talaromyces atroroseus TaxID=1441469 RepID=A0A225AN18_TALAT|nr:60S ribosomal subunit assembly/export protein LOC1 [Talaromyces atroroseus]OKL56989.1 60S ribosomal subunit assembly/export protein LOC1 [Talaromyces atroroseus]
MAPTSSKGKTPSTNKGNKSASSGYKVSKSSSKAKVKRPPPKEVKSQSRSAPNRQKKTKTREYTEKELDLPALNMITPVGVQTPRGKKKGKTFVDDQESMMTILAIVSAEKEGQIESKMMKARQMEEIREAKRKEAEARADKRKSKLENIKDELRNKKKKKSSNGPTEDKEKGRKSKEKRKSVSFA